MIKACLIHACALVSGFVIVVGLTYLAIGKYVMHVAINTV